MGEDKDFTQPASFTGAAFYRQYERLRDWVSGFVSGLPIILSRL